MIAPPEDVRAASKDYMDESDWLGEFLAACCTSTPEYPGASVSVFAKHLWSRYQAWCTESGTEQYNRSVLGRALSKAGFPRSKSGIVSRLGIRLLTENDQPDTSTESEPDISDPERFSH